MFATVRAACRYPSGWTQWWVGSISPNDLNFTAEHTGRIDYGAPGISSLFAGKTATSAQPPFVRRVLFGFTGWSTGAPCRPPFSATVVHRR